MPHSLVGASSFSLVACLPKEGHAAVVVHTTSQARPGPKPTQAPKTYYSQRRRVVGAGALKTVHLEYLSVLGRPAKSIDPLTAGQPSNQIDTAERPSRLSTLRLTNAHIASGTTAGPSVFLVASRCLEVQFTWQALDDGLPCLRSNAVLPTSQLLPGAVPVVPLAWPRRPSGCHLQPVEKQAYDPTHGLEKSCKPETAAGKLKLTC